MRARARTGTRSRYKKKYNTGRTKHRHFYPLHHIYTLHVRSKYSANKSEWLFVAKSQVAAAKNCSMRKQQTNTNEKKREITEARKRKSTHWGKKRQVHC